MDFSNDGSHRTIVPGQFLWGFLPPTIAASDLWAALVANCLRGALPPVNLRAVCYQEVWKGAKSHHKVFQDDTQGGAKTAIYCLVRCGGVNQGDQWCPQGPP